MSRQFIVSGLVIWGLGFYIAAGTHANTLHVEKWGDNNAECGAGNNPCRNIQYTIERRSNAFDRVVVGPGVYHENVRIGSNASGHRLNGLRLESMLGASATLIRPKDPMQPVIGTDNVSVHIGKGDRGFSVAGSGSSSTAPRENGGRRK